MIYFNEFDTGPAQWLQNAFPDASVDDRSIIDVQPDDLVGFHRVHFFAGIGGWELALRLAGWPADLPVWTGSCPCQPFSVAGKGAGTADPRHLWPEMRRLIDVCRPPIVFGEQVASSAGRAWLAGVRLDLEAMGYSVGAADLCAAGAGAPHIRQRLYWGAVRVADSGGQGLAVGVSNGRIQPETVGAQQREASISGSAVDRMANGDGFGCDSRSAHARPETWTMPRVGNGDSVDRLPDTPSERLPARQPGMHADPRKAEPSDTQTGGLPDPDRDRRDREEILPRRWRPDEADPDAARGCRFDAWSDFDVLALRDGTSRRTQSGVHPLAYGVPGRVVKLRGYGNAIVPQVAATFIKAFAEAAGIE